MKLDTSEIADILAHTKENWDRERVNCLAEIHEKECGSFYIFVCGNSDQVGVFANDRIITVFGYNESISNEWYAREVRAGRLATL